MLDQITPLVLTYNEAPNIARTLSKLAWARRVVVIDSGSNDGTLEILGQNANVEVHRRAFDTFAAQCNFGLSLVTTPWVLSLDADYVMSDDLVKEVSRLMPPSQVVGYRARFAYCVHGHRLRGTLYPPRTVLYRVADAHYENIGHSHRVVVSGEIRQLTGMVDHDDRKSLGRWMESQRRYAGREVAYLMASNPAELGWVDRLRLKMWIAPLVSIPYVLIARGCIFDGWPGWYYAFQRAYAETLMALEIMDHRLEARSDR